MFMNASPSIGRLGLVWLLVFTLASFTVRPLTAASQPNGLDVARIDTFVREQVQRQGLPGLALALVDGDQIVYMGGYGKADQRGRAVTPQNALCIGLSE